MSRKARPSGTKTPTGSPRSLSMPGTPVRRSGSGSAVRSGSRLRPQIRAEAVHQPDAAGESGKNGQHDEAEGTRDIAERGAKRMAEKVAESDEACRPYPGRDEVQRAEPLPAHRAQPHRKRGQVAHSVDEAERQNKAGIVALQPFERGGDAAAPMRETAHDAVAEMATEPKIALVAAEAAEPRGEEKRRRADEPLRRRKAGEQHDRLALEKRPGERDQVKPGAVLCDQPINIHSQMFPPRRRPWATRPRAPGKSPVATPHRVSNSTSPVERIPLRGREKRERAGDIRRYRKQPQRGERDEG